MNPGKSKSNQEVVRFTIDEKLEVNLIRLLRVSLKPGIKKFNDDAKYWQDEIELDAHPSTFRKIMGLSTGQAKKWNWESFKEGQVFLSGPFKTNNNKKSRLLFEVNPGRFNFRRIDKLLKDNIKTKYLSALRGDYDV